MGQEEGLLSHPAQMSLLSSVKRLNLLQWPVSKSHSGNFSHCHCSRNICSVDDSHSRGPLIGLNLSSLRKNLPSTNCGHERDGEKRGSRHHTPVPPREVSSCYSQLIVDTWEDIMNSVAASTQKHGILITRKYWKESCYNTCLGCAILWAQTSAHKNQWEVGKSKLEPIWGKGVIPVNNNCLLNAHYSSWSFWDIV